MCMILFYLYYTQVFSSQREEDEGKGDEGKGRVPSMHASYLSRFGFAESRGKLGLKQLVLLLFVVFNENLSIWIISAQPTNQRWHAADLITNTSCNDDDVCVVWLWSMIIMTGWWWSIWYRYCLHSNKSSKEPFLVWVKSCIYLSYLSIYIHLPRCVCRHIYFHTMHFLLSCILLLSIYMYNYIINIYLSQRLTCLSIILLFLYYPLHAYSQSVNRSVGRSVVRWYLAVMYILFILICNIRSIYYYYYWYWW